jgi:FAD synthetase
MVRKVMAFGTFDVLHPGHLSYLRQSKAWGDYLVVVVSTDAHAFKVKGKKPVFCQDSRAQLVRSLRFVDEVALGLEGNYFDIVSEFKPNVVSLGYDHEQNEHELEIELKKIGVNSRIVRCDPFNEKEFKSSIFKKKICEQ